MRKVLILLPVFIFIFSGINYSQTCQDASVELSAVVQASPPRITLNWVASTTTTDYIVYRKLKTGTAWGTAIDTLAGTETQYIDSTVVMGESYEYKVTRIGANYTGFGYINAGIEVPAIEERGR